MTGVVCFFIGATCGAFCTLFFSAKAIDAANLRAEESEEIVRKLIHEKNTKRSAWKGESA